MPRNKGQGNGIVFSTDPEFKPFQEEPFSEETLAPANQKLIIKLDTKQRGGKAVTLISNFVGKSEDLESLGKQLKTFCGTGGSVKDGQIIIQGDQRDKVMGWLKKQGYAKTKF